jgi:uncharacterized membrane protein
MEVIQNIYSGPLPRPQDFAAYNQILPGAADRILTLAETQAAHRQLLELRAVTADMIQAATGTVLGYLAFFFTMGGGIFLLTLDKPIEGLVALVTALGVAFGPKIYRDFVHHDDTPATT